MWCPVLIQHRVPAARNILRRRALGLEDMYSGQSAPKLLRDAVPLRRQKPDPSFPLDVMVVGVCPKAGDGILRLRWKTKKRIELEREWLVNRGLPGEVVELSFGVVKEKNHPPGEMDIMVLPGVKRVRKSEFETRALCAHYDHCGGCDFLNLRYGRQLIEKQRWVERAVHQSHNSLAVLRRIRPSEPQTRFAHRIEWVFSETDGEVRFGPAGIAPLGSEGEPPSRCVLPPKTSLRALTALFEEFQSCHRSDPWTYSIYEEVRGHGIFKSVVAICTRPPPSASEGARTELLVNIVLADTIENVAEVLRPFVDALLSLMPKRLVGVVANVARSKRAIMGGRMEFLLHGRRYARQELAVAVGGQARPFVLELGAGSRLVAHTRMLPEVAQKVLEMCSLQPSDTVWHCFAGAGELTLGLSAVAEHVVAIGTSPAEVAELKRSLSANSVGNTTSVLANLRSPWTLKHLSFHISQSQQRRLLLGSGEEQEKAREYAIAAFVPGESRRRQLQRLSAAPFNASLLREDALAHRELRTLLPAFVRDFRPTMTTLPALRGGPSAAEDEKVREVPAEMEGRLKRMYRKLALKYHPDRNPDNPEASQRFQALTRAYKALVGDTAGPEEGDEDVQDPFEVAMASSYRPKFKHKWREDSKGTRSSAAESGQRYTAVRNSEAGEDGEATDQEGDEEESEEDDDLAVNLEIDDSWARGSEADDHPAQTVDLEMHSSQEGQLEAVIFDEQGISDLTSEGSAAPMPTLPPPDVIVVSQPRDRKAGRGTPKHFIDWLRSTAVRTLVYVSRDSDAFKEDVLRLRGLGYRLQQVQPFDVEPHRRSILVVAKLELVRPLEGAADYGPDGEKLIPGSVTLLPSDERPLLGSGGYSIIPPPAHLSSGNSKAENKQPR